MNNKIPKVILLVEDEILIAMVQKKFLEQYGYNVITIETGEKAVEILKSDMKISEICLLPDSRKIPLEKFGYKVIMVDSAERAVNAYKANDNIDLVLMDIDLGKGMDGTEAVT